MIDVAGDDRTKQGRLPFSSLHIEYIILIGMIIQKLDHVLQHLIVAKMRCIMNYGPVVTSLAYLFRYWERWETIPALDHIPQLIHISLDTAVIQSHFFFYSVLWRQVVFSALVCDHLIILRCLQIHIRNIPRRPINHCRRQLHPRPLCRTPGRIIRVILFIVENNLHFQLLNVY